jgi:hypothetical protein
LSTNLYKATFSLYAIIIGQLPRKQGNFHTNNKKSRRNGCAVSAPKASTGRRRPRGEDSHANNYRRQIVGSSRI